MAQANTLVPAIMIKMITRETNQDAFFVWLFVTFMSFEDHFSCFSVSTVLKCASLVGLKNFQINALGFPLRMVCNNFLKKRILHYLCITIILYTQLSYTHECILHIFIELPSSSLVAAACISALWRLMTHSISSSSPSRQLSTNVRTVPVGQWVALVTKKCVLSSTSLSC